MLSAPRLVVISVVTAAVAALSLAPLAVAAPPDPGAPPSGTAWPDAAITAWAAGSGISITEAARRAVAQDRTTAVATGLAQRLGDRAAGAWLDSDGRLTVAVLNAADAVTVKRAGAGARIVDTSLAELERAATALDRTGAPTGASWGVDVLSNSLRVTVPAGTDAKPLLDAAAGQGVAVTVTTTESVPVIQAFYGGEAILLNRGGRCSAGFITQSAGGTPYLLTAGHCTSGTASFTDESRTTIGPTAASSFPGNDFGAVRISSPASLDPQGGVATSSIIAGDGAGEEGIVDVTGAGRVPVGGQVCKAGSTTGYTCGTVRAYNVSVNYAEGLVGGLTQTDVCTQPGDSGGALIAGDLGQGMVSGGSSNVGCGSSSFRSFFQPLDEVLSVYGLSVR